MANTFALILAIATLITGIIWVFEKFKWAPARRRLAKQALDDGALEVEDYESARQASPLIDALASFFPILAIVFVLRSFLYEPFQIPSGSMMPTLLIGDFIVVEKFSYGVKDPISHRMLKATGAPKRGDIAVFKYPLNPRIDYIKRVVGLPGDKIRYNETTKTLSILANCDNGNEPACGVMRPLVYTNIADSSWVVGEGTSKGASITRFYQLTDGVNQGVSRLLGPQRLLIGNEDLGGKTHEILISSQAPLLAEIKEWFVPAGHYFMMGDNRDFSADSRGWGFVPEKNLVGKAVAIWLSLEKQEGEWPTGIRFNRIGRIE